MITREDIMRIVDDELAGIRERFAERHAAELARVKKERANQEQVQRATDVLKALNID